jgi:LCP family protein required for cell wall assembly
MKVASVAVLSILAIGMTAFFGWMGLSAYRQRQGPALDSTAAPLFATHTPQAAIDPATQIPATVTMLATATIEVTLTVSPTAQATGVVNSQTTVCGGSGAWNVLVLGSDYAEMRGQKGSDLTRMLRADFTNKHVIIYAFSRDLWVDTSGLGLVNPNIDATRLGMVYYEGRIRSPQFAEIDTVIDGTRATARMLSKDFSLGTDHYLTIDLNHLAAMIDAIGGLPINIPSRTTDPWIGMVIEAGQQTLNGTQAVAYIRARPDSDFGRIARNDILLEALRQKLLDPAVMARIPDLYAQFRSVIATDLSLEQINNLTCLLKEVPSSSIIQESVRPEWTSPGPLGSLLWDKNSVITRLKELGLIQ